jgi:antitoxin (DNA-binding transcriptional repressor) of toxin-antitoxin stability system
MGIQEERSGHKMSLTKFLSIREVQQKGSKIKEILEDDVRIIITSNGKPIALTIGVDEDSFDETLEDLKKVRQLKHRRYIDRKLDESEMMVSEPDAQWIDEDDFWAEE